MGEAAGSSEEESSAEEGEDSGEMWGEDGGEGPSESGGGSGGEPSESDGGSGGEPSDEEEGEEEEEADAHYPNLPKYLIRYALCKDQASGLQKRPPNHNKCTRVSTPASHPAVVCPMPAG